MINRGDFQHLFSKKDVKTKLKLYLVVYDRLCHPLENVTLFGARQCACSLPLTAVR